MFTVAASQNFMLSQVTSKSFQLAKQYSLSASRFPSIRSHRCLFGSTTARLAVCMAVTSSFSLLSCLPASSFDFFMVINAHK